MSKHQDHIGPSVSIIMPAFNNAKYIRQTLDSLLAQDDPEFELLVHNDGSTDATLDILKQYASRDRRIVLSSDRNRGVSWSQNLMIQKARSQYIMMIDADDICRTERLRSQKAYLEAHPDCVAVGTGYLLIDAENRPITSITNVSESHKEIDSRNLQGIVSIHQPTVMARRDALLEVGGYLEDYPMAEDIDMWLRLGEIGKLANIPDDLISYRIHSESVSGANRQQQKEGVYKACQAAWLRRGEKSEFLYTDWRMGLERASRLQYYLMYGWQSWNSGYRETWKYYAFQTIRIAPWSLKAWKLLIFGFLYQPKISPK